MRRIIGTIGATLAVVAAIATPAAAQGPTFGFDLNPTVDKIRVTSAAGGADGGSLDNPRFLYASVGGGNDTVDVAGLDNIGRGTSVTLDAPFIGYKDTGSAATSPLIGLVDTYASGASENLRLNVDEGTLLVDFPASADEQRNQFIDRNLNPGMPMDSIDCISVCAVHA
jgi:hypothetical protein